MRCVAQGNVRETRLARLRLFCNYHTCTLLSLRSRPSNQASRVYSKKKKHHGVLDSCNFSSRSFKKKPSGAVLLLCTFLRHHHKARQGKARRKGSFSFLSVSVRVVTDQKQKNCDASPHIVCVASSRLSWVIERRRPQHTKSLTPVSRACVHLRV